MKMKRLQLPKNKLARLVINILFIVVWPIFWIYFEWFIEKWLISETALNPIHSDNDIYPFFFFLVTILIPVFGTIFLVTRYIWFEKSRNRIFFGLFDRLKDRFTKLKSNLNKYEPRIYTTTSSADELKKYAELKDQGIITEEEFQAKKKQILGF